MESLLSGKFIPYVFSMAKEPSQNFEAQLFKAADKLRKNIDAVEYKNVALGLIFLKYISESFQELYDKLAQDEFSDPEIISNYINKRFN